MNLSREGSVAFAIAALIGSSLVAGSATSTIAQAAPATSRLMIVPTSAADGVLGGWTDVSTPGGASFLNAELRSLLFVDDTLYVGGLFTNMPGVDDSYVSSWSAIDDTWHSLATTSLSLNQSNSGAYALALSNDDTLFVGGNFTTPGGGTNAVTLADGVWYDMVVGLDGYVQALSIKDDTLYAGGSFTLGVNDKFVASWPLAGGTWKSLGNETLAGALSPSVNALSWIDDTLVVGGSNLTLPSINVAWLGTASTEWQPLGVPTNPVYATNQYGLGNFVYASVTQDDTIYFAGRFTDDQPTGVNNMKRIAAWSISNRSWTELGGGITAAAGDGPIYALALDDTHQILYLGGDFDFAGSQAATNVVAWDLRLSEWVPFQWGSTDQGLDSSSAVVRAFAVDDSLVYVGGAFFNAGGNPDADRLARWTWEPPAGAGLYSVTDDSLTVSGEGFIGVATTGAVVLDDTTTPGVDDTAVEYSVDDSATITLRGLSGLGVGTYEVQVEGVGGIGGVGQITVTSTPPLAPVLTSVAGGNASLTLNWALGPDGGSPVTDVEYTTDDSVTWRSVDDSTATTDTISVDSSGNPLVNGTTYQVRIRAVNSVGNGLASNMIPGTPTNPTPPPPIPTFPPSAPLSVTGQAGNATATVTWAAPASAGSFPVTDYQVVVAPGGQTCLVQAPATSCTVTGLTNGMEYTAIVRALNGAGWGAWSDPSGPFTPMEPVEKSIVITGTRAQIDGRSGARAVGETTGLTGATLQARVHLSGEVDYYDGSRRTVAQDGSFTWQRFTNKKVYVYFRTLDGKVRSNRIVIAVN